MDHKEYEQFGDEWKIEMIKNNKNSLVGMIRNISAKYNKLKEQSTILSRAFASCGNQIEDMKNCQNCDVNKSTHKHFCNGCKRSICATTDDQSDHWCMEKYS